MNFLQFTELMKNSSKPDKENIRGRVLANSRPKWIKRTALCCAMLLMIGIIATGGIYFWHSLPRGKDNHLPEHLKNVSTIAAVTASGQSDSIATDSVFKITTLDTATTEEVSNALDISPESEYTIKKTSGNTFSLTFDNTMQGDTLYTFKSKSGNKTVYSWAFQTESEFKVTKASTDTVQSPSAIWVEFSSPDVEDFEQYFSISPAISGTFEKYGARWVFIPSTEFENDTVYRVTVSKDIQNKNGQTLEEDYSFNFISQGETWSEYSYRDSISKCESFTVNEQPAATIEYSGTDMSDVSVELFAINDADDFIRIHKDYVRNGAISDAIAQELSLPVSSFETDTLIINDGTAYFRYPGSYQSGYYISQITSDDTVCYHIFQVTELAVYAVSAESDCSLWVYDTATGSPRSGLTLTADNGTTAITNEKGIAAFTGLDISDLCYIKTDSIVPYVCITTVSTDEADVSYDIKSYISTDRNIIRAGDTVKVIGFTDVLSTDDKNVGSIELISGFDGSKTEVTPDSNGMFSASVQLPDTIQTDGYIDLSINGKTAATAYLYYEDNSSDKYFVSVKTDKAGYIEGETVDYTFYAEFADGTPAENVEILTGGESITTNSRGIATLQEIAKGAGLLRREFAAVQPEGVTVLYADYTVYETGYFIRDVHDSVTSLTVDIGFAPGFDDETDKQALKELHRVTYRTEKTDSRYDPVSESYTPTFRCYAEDEVLNSDHFDIADGVSIPYTIPADGQMYYMLFKWGDHEYRHYITGGDISVKDTDCRYSFTGRSEFDVGAKVNLTLNDMEYGKVNSGSVVLFTVNGGIITGELYDASAVSFDFLQEYCPDVYAVGAYCDGQRLYPIEKKLLAEREEKLEIVIDTEKNSFLPGETVNADIFVLSNGKPQKATVYLNVTDYYITGQSGIYETLRASQTQESDIHQSISTYTLNDLNKTSQTKELYSERYCSSVYFATVTTDDAGKATVSFELPESAADYTICAKAIDGNFASGQSQVEISCAKELYIRPFIADSYDTESDVGFAFKFIGNDNGHECEYTATLFKDGIQTDTVTGSADFEQFKNESFGKLEKGSYSIEITGGDGSRSDTVTCEFVVEEHIDRAFNIQDSTQGLDGDIAVTLYDSENELYLTVLEKMLTLSSARLDHILANTGAKNILTGNKSENILPDFFTSEGVKNPDSDSYATLTQAALLTASAKDSITSDSILGYFKNAINNYPDTTALISCNLVYAANRMPVLDDLNSLKDVIADMTYEQKIYLALAYAYAGDYNTAYSVIDEQLAINIRSANGTASFEADTPYESEYLTCLAATVTSKVSHSYARELIKGLISGNDSVLSGIAYYTFVNSFVPPLEGENTVEYTNLSGEKELITYKRTDTVTLIVPSNEADKIRFDDNSERTLVSYTGFKSVQCEPDTDVIEMTVSNDEINDGDMFIITVKIDISEKEFELPYATVELPSGLKLISATVTEAGGYTVTGEQTELHFSDDVSTTELVCYAAIEGDYTVFSPIICGADSENYIKGEDITIEIR